MNYSEDEKAIIFLSLFDKLSYKKQRELLALYTYPAELLRRLYVDEESIKKIVGEKVYEDMTDKCGAFLNSYIKNLNDMNVRCITIASEIYPSKLKYIFEPPIILFAKGNLELLNSKSVAIVGTRNPSAYGREITAEFSESIAKRGICVISGLAAGVDKISHENALKVQGKTIAVLGGGFNKIYPAMNTNLANEIFEKGLILSEYSPSREPTRYTFPYRNRIISGLADCVLITEAGEKSGALYTKQYAQDEGKTIFAIPSNITNIRAVGTNKLIKTREAKCAISPDDILSEFCLSVEENKNTIKSVNQQISIVDKQILDALEDKNQTFDELSVITGLDAKSLNSNLTMLQIRGLIKKLPGNEFSL